MKILQLAENIFVSDQIYKNDIQILASEGFGSIVNNRPDREEINQPLSQELELTAKDLGVFFVHIPVVTVPITNVELKAFNMVFDRLEKPTLLFCRTGHRSSEIWRAHSILYG